MLVGVINFKSRTKLTSTLSRIPTFAKLSLEDVLPDIKVIGLHSSSSFQGLELIYHNITEINDKNRLSKQNIGKE